MKKNKKKLIITISIILAILLVVIAIIFMFKKEEEEKKKKLEMVTKIPNVVLKDDGVAKYVDGEEIKTKIKEDNDVFEVLEEVGGYFKIDKPKDVFSIKEKRESADFTYYRLSQKYNNVKVYGHELNVAVDKDNKVTSITGDYVPIDYVSTYSSISIEEIEEKLPELLGEDFKLYEKTPYIYINEDEPVYSYIYVILTSKGMYDIVVDAKEAIIIEKISTDDFSDFAYVGEDVHGEKKHINLNKTLIGTYEFHDINRNIIIANGDAVGVDTDSVVGSLSLLGYLLLPKVPLSVILCDNGELSINACITSGENITKNSIGVMHNFEYVYDYYYKNFGLKSFDGEGGKILVSIGVSSKWFNDEDYYNAAWVGSFASEFVFGSINGVSLGIEKDILAHEYTHAVSEHIVNFGTGEAGALNEAYSDILGSLIEGKNFKMGEGLIELRDLTNPHSHGNPTEKDGKYYFPTDTDIYNEEWKKANGLGDDWLNWDKGGSHQNSTVASYAAFLMYDNGAFKNKDEMAKVWYNSLFMLSPTSDFEDCALAVIKTAKNLNLSDEKVKIIEDAFITTNMLSSSHATLSGKVLDSNTKEPLAGVSVIAINKMNSHVSYEVTTNEKGEYEFNSLPPVDYTITFEIPKYKGTEKEIKLDKGKNVLDASLELIPESNYKESEIVFVLDISLSMDESDPTDIRKQIMANILASLDSNSKVGLVVFAGKSKIINNGLSNKSVDKKILATDIFNMTNDNGHNENSGTNGRSGLEKGMSMFTSNKTRKYIVFLTDGEDNKYTGLTYEELINKANQMGVRILTIGLGKEGQINESILKKVANDTNGKYYYANNSTKLYEFDKKIFEELE